MTQFVATVLAETEDVWNGIMKSQGFEYPEPTLVLFSGAVASACGNASSASGPFYCPGDQKVYIDLSRSLMNWRGGSRRRVISPRPMCLPTKSAIMFKT
jgi:predicted metalloprotease